VCHFFQLHTLHRRRKTPSCFYIRRVENPVANGPSEIPSSLCGIASSLIVPSPLPSLGSPSERYLSQIALRPHIRPAYLRPPLPTLKRKLFWVLPIHRSLVPSSPGPCASFRIVGLSPPIPFPSTYPLVPFVNSLNYMLIHSPPPSQSGLPHPSRGPTSSFLSSVRLISYLTPYPCTCLSSLPRPLRLSSRYSLSPPSDGPPALYRLADSPSPLLPQAQPPTLAWVTHIAPDLYLSSHLNER